MQNPFMPNDLNVRLYANEEGDINVGGKMYSVTYDEPLSLFVSNAVMNLDAMKRRNHEADFGLTKDSTYEAGLSDKLFRYAKTNVKIYRGADEGNFYRIKNKKLQYATMGDDEKIRLDIQGTYFQVRFINFESTAEMEEFLVNINKSLNKEITAEYLT
jgi:hypothetical protein